MAKTHVRFTLNDAETALFVDEGANLIDVLRRGRLHTVHNAVCLFPRFNKTRVLSTARCRPHCRRPPRRRPPRRREQRACEKKTCPPSDGGHSVVF